MRRGFTLVEVLIVFVIVAVLVALTIPAIGRIRASANRTECGNNLKQLISGALAYNDANGFLPISVTSNDTDLPTPLPSPRTGRGWILETLPYIEQKPLYLALNDSMTGNFSANLGLKSPTCINPTATSPAPIATLVPILRCKSDNSPSVSSSQTGFPDITVAVTNYKGVAGTCNVNGSWSDPTMYLATVDGHNDTTANGLFFRNSGRVKIRATQIPDGASNTFAIGEDISEKNPAGAAYYSDGDWASSHVPLNYDVANDFKNITSNDQKKSFRSRHEGGVNFAAADGSVRFLLQTIDHNTYRKLCTRNGGTKEADATIPKD